jgi:hypothetical protein
MQSHVVSSKAQKKSAAMRLSAAPTSGAPPSLLGRLSTAMFGSRGSAATESASSTSEKPNRSYGFSTQNAAIFTDKTSEDLYRYKNLSSSYMRSSSPDRDEEDKPAPAIVEKDSDNEGSDNDSGAATSRKPRRGSKK